MERLNPCGKAATVLACALILSFSYSVALNSGIFLSCMTMLLTASHAKKSTVCKVMLPALLAAGSLFLSGFLFGRGQAGTVAENSLDFANAVFSWKSWYNGLQLGTRVLAYAGLGMLFTLTTDAEDFVCSLMHQLHLPPKFAYGVLAAIHLLPDLKREYEDARIAFEVRGMRTAPWSLKPLTAALVNGIRWSESLAMAMESKGFDGDGKRSFYRKTEVRACDWIFALTCIALTGAGALLCLSPFAL